MPDRLIGFILAAGTGLLLGGRFDTYDRQSKRTGWGTITRESGEVQVYDNNGNRVGSGRSP
jgi:hypothetical protein